MNRVVALFLMCLGLSTSLSAKADEEILIPFYSEQVRIHYRSDLLKVGKPEMTEQGLRAYFRDMSQTGYGTIIRSLQQARKAFRLNDWLYYQLIKQVLRQIYGQHDPLERTLAAWFLLSQSGFDTRLTYLEAEAYLYAYTEDEVFEAPIIKDKGRSYINLTRVQAGRAHQKALYLLGFAPNPTGHAFSFYLPELPRLKPDLQEHTVRFFYEKEWHAIKVEVDENIAAFMEGYPIIAEEKYLEVPVSRSLAKSLFPPLRQMLRGKNEWQKAELLAAFTRSAFVYKEDKAYFGCSKPMVAEEVFIHPYSDCEDRTALFFQLTKKLLPLPTIVVAYADHLTLAVALPKAEGSSIHYEGENYYFCDPTGPIRDQRVGIVPEGYEDKPFKVIKHYSMHHVNQGN